MRGLRVMTPASLLHRYRWAVERYDLLELEMGCGGWRDGENGEMDAR